MHAERIETSSMLRTEANWLIEQCFTSPPTQYRLYGRRFLQAKKPNQQYQSTEGESCKEKNTKNIKKTENTHTQNSIQITVTQINTASPLVYNNMGWGRSKLRHYVAVDSEKDLEITVMNDGKSCGQGLYAFNKAWTTLAIRNRTITISHT